MVTSRVLWDSALGAILRAHGLGPSGAKKTTLRGPRHTYLALALLLLEEEAEAEADAAVTSSEAHRSPTQSSVLLLVVGSLVRCERP